MILDEATYQRRSHELKWSEHKAAIIRRIAVDRATYEQVAHELLMKVEAVRKVISRESERILQYERARARDAELEEAAEESDDLNERARVLRSMVQNREVIGGSGGAGEQAPFRVARLTLYDYRKIIEKAGVGA